ncbi:F0F1 ATP synthase subunit epsilon [Thalassovita taeanensis]|nr:F0F1 ATP synthase subunit epsilon [Thalassovita taeanensis]
MRLIISTPLDVIVDADDVRSLRAEDESGGFGVLPGHVPLLTVLRACVVRWRRESEGWAFCALRGGVLTVENGATIRIACRQGILGADLSTLEGGVHEHLAQESEKARAARVEHARMHVRAIRQIMLHISDGGDLASDVRLDEVFQ